MHYSSVRAKAFFLTCAFVWRWRIKRWRLACSWLNTGSFSRTFSFQGNFPGRQRLNHPSCKLQVSCPENNRWRNYKYSVFFKGETTHFSRLETSMNNAIELLFFEKKNSGMHQVACQKGRTGYCACSLICICHCHWSDPLYLVLFLYIFKWKVMSQGAKERLASCSQWLALFCVCMH